MGKAAPSPSGPLTAHALDFLAPGLADHSASSPAVPFQEGKGSMCSRPLAAPRPETETASLAVPFEPPPAPAPPGGCGAWFCLSGVWGCLGETHSSPPPPPPRARVVQRFVTIAGSRSKSLVSHFRHQRDPGWFGK